MKSNLDIVSISPEPVNFTGKGHVIIIDDDVQILDVISLIVRHHGYTYEAYKSANGFDIKYDELRNRKRATCILSDVKMPGIDGLNLQKNLNGSLKIPLILMSGNCTPREVVEAFQGPLINFLVKPFDNNDMLSAISAAILIDVDNLKNERRIKNYEKRLSDLSPQEKVVACMIENGATSQKIADDLKIGLRTVKLYRQKIYEKLEVGSHLEFIEAINLVKSNPAGK